MREPTPPVIEPCTEVTGRLGPPAGAMTRAFILAAILIALTAGGGWGVWLLFVIGGRGSFTEVSIHGVNAHGQAQVFGWMSLLVIGLLYALLPHLWRCTLAWPRLAWAVLCLLVAGVAVRWLGLAMAGQGHAAAQAALAGGLAQMLAIMLFVAQSLATWHRSGARIEPWTGFVFAAMALFVFQAGFSTWHLWQTMTADSRADLLWYLATYQAPLRDVQLRGFGLLMLLGLSIWLLPAMYGLGPVSPRRAWAALLVLLAGLTVAVTAFIGWRFTGARSGTGFLYLSWIAMIVGICMIALPWRLWWPMPVVDAGAKFIRAAFAWLAVSFAMLLLLPGHRILSGIDFSHAYYGAIRHAIAMGFISMLLIGVLSRLMRMRGETPGRPAAHAFWGPFILLNAGCALRVLAQTSSDFASPAFYLLGVSGVLELAAIGWWGVNLVGPGRRRAAATADVGPPPSPEQPSGGSPLPRPGTVSLS